MRGPGLCLLRNEGNWHADGIEKDPDVSGGQYVFSLLCSTHTEVKHCHRELRS